MLVSWHPYLTITPLYTKLLTIAMGSIKRLVMPMINGSSTKQVKNPPYMVDDVAAEGGTMAAMLKNCIT